MTRSRGGNAARVALSVLSLLLLAAHFYHQGAYPLVVAALALGGLAFVARPWAGRALGFVLLCGALEWLHTAWTLAEARASLQQPYARLLLILGTVAAVTVAAALVSWRSDQARPGPETD